MKKMMTILTMTTILTAACLAENTLSVVRQSASSAVIQLNNTDVVAGVQFSIRSSSDLILSNPTAIDRTSGSVWTVATYKPNDSTINVVIISMQQAALSSGSGSLLQISYASLGGADESSIALADVKLAGTNAGVVSVTTEGARWSNSSTISDASTDSRSFVLGQNYPNPFNPSTRISYTLNKPSHVRLCVYDIIGREVNRLVDAYQQAGSFSATFNSTSGSGQMLASGMYFARLTVGNESAVRKMILTK